MRDRHLDELEQADPKAHHYISCVWHTLGDGALTSFLLFMSLRLVEMKRVLKPTGSIYLHCDHHASHYLKQLMDIVFGTDNFRNEIIWAYNKWTNAASHFQKNHDVILSYAKANDVEFNPQYAITEDKKKKLEIGYVTNTVGKGRDKTKQLIVYDREKARHKIKEGNYDRVVYAEDKQGTLMPDVWTDINILNSQAKERTGYPTQKPVALYERIIKASSNKGGFVLDPFCGCATTLVAAENLGRQWIGIDIHPETRKIVANRIAKACNLNSPDGSVMAESNLLNLERDLDIHTFTKENFPVCAN